MSVSDRQTPPIQWELAQSETIGDARDLLKRLARARELSAELDNPPGIDRMEDPHRLRGIPQAVEILASALRERQRILVHGDYDVDGLVATAMVARSLRWFGAEVDTHIPDRFEDGYGLNAQRMSELGQSHDLIISVDCGIRDVESVRLARAAGARLILTDHHQPGGELPPADAIVNPHQPECPSRQKQLCGAAVALKLIVALRRHMDAPELRLQFLLPLVALATVADVIPLRDESRMLVREGLRLFSRHALPGLHALCQVSRCDPNHLRSEDLAFQLAPRLNASGRLEHANLSLQLLLSDTPDESLELAHRLQHINQRRREETRTMQQQARELIATEQLDQYRCILVAAEHWNSGLLGLVAARLREHFGKPAIACSLDCATGEARGSCRSIPAVDIQALLSRQAALFERFGGHPMAAGFSMQSRHIPELRLALDAELQSLPADWFQPRLQIDARLDPTLLHLETLDALRALEPWGAGNPQPLFCTRLQLDDLQQTRDGRHTQLFLRTADGRGLRAICFNRRLRHRRPQPCEIAFGLRENTWNQRREINIIVEDIRFG